MPAGSRSPSNRKSPMTELVVALDGSHPADLAADLFHRAGVRWFKIGPQAMTSPGWFRMIDGAQPGEANVFLDLKLADTRDTVREAVKRFADAGIAAVSTFTMDATIAAAEAAEGTDLRVWQVLMLSDDARLPISGLGVRSVAANGIICPPRSASIFEGCGIDVVCPGVRLKGEDHGGHIEAWPPSFVLAAGATHAVVGRPIWQSADPIVAARLWRAELSWNPGIPSERMERKAVG